MMDHFGDESFQAINSAGTDSQRTICDKQLKEKHENTHKETRLKPTGPSSPVRTAHMSAHNWVHFRVQHRTVLIIFRLILHTVIIAWLNVCSRGGRGRIIQFSYMLAQLHGILYLTILSLPLTLTDLKGFLNHIYSV